MPGCRTLCAALKAGARDYLHDARREARYGENGENWFLCLGQAPRNDRKRAGCLATTRALPKLVATTTPIYSATDMCRRHSGTWLAYTPVPTTRFAAHCLPRYATLHPHAHTPYVPATYLFATTYSVIARCLLDRWFEGARVAACTRTQTRLRMRATTRAYYALHRISRGSAHSPACLLAREIGAILMRARRSPKYRCRCPSLLFSPFWTITWFG